MSSFISSRGFRFHSEEGREASYYYGLLRDVYDQYIFGRLNNNTRLRTVRLIMSLCKIDFPQVNNKQLSVGDYFYNVLINGEFTSNHQKFAADALRYGCTGYRRLPIAAYQSIIDSDQTRAIQSGYARHVTTRQESRAHHLVEEAKLLKGIVEEKGGFGNLQFYKHWLEQEEGFLDMVNTFCFMLEPLTE